MRAWTLNIQLGVYAIGWFVWGLCAVGPAQFQFPWGWPMGSPPPEKWFHCLLYPDGTPYSAQEILDIHQFVGSESSAAPDSVPGDLQQLRNARWEKQKAFQYMEKFGEVKGCNYVPRITAPPVPGVGHDYIKMQTKSAPRSGRHYQPSHRQ
jgi:hypothetical protein